MLQILTNNCVKNNVEPFFSWHEQSMIWRKILQKHLHILGFNIFVTTSDVYVLLFFMAKQGNTRVCIVQNILMYSIYS